MTTPILQTKLKPPTPRPYLISRPQLLEKLQAGLTGKLTLVSAPAGSGKTTLIADWGRRLVQTAVSQSAAHGPQLCWLSLDPYDDDPNQFWRYVVAALQTADPRLGTMIESLLSATPLPPPPAILTDLLNQLAALPRTILLALDDYQLISDPVIHDGLGFLLERAPPQLHVIVITRADPPLALARLRARGLLSEIRAADLRFSADEAAVFLRDAMGLALSTAEVAALETRTEGWITGLHLTAVSLQARGDVSDFIKDFSSSQAYILEYLTEEVLHQLPENVQTFLLQTSLLSRLSGLLCDAVTGRSDSQAVLLQLYRQNLFIIPLDDTHSWFRIHHLLADLLRNHLQLTVSPERLRALHRRASAWWQAQGVWETAVTHAIASQDWDHVADLVANAYQPLLAQGRIATWQRWLAQIPAPIIEAKPALHMRQGWAEFLKGHVFQAESRLQAARQSLLALPQSAEQRALRGELATYLATVAFFRGEPDDIIRSAEEALAFLPPDALTARARATSALGLGTSLSGDTRRARHLFEETVALARPGGNPFFLAHALEVLADGQYHAGRLREAAATCREIIALGTDGRAAPLPFAGNGYVRLAGILVEWRELAQAEEAMTLGLTLNRQGGIGYNALQDLCTQVRLWQAVGDESRALAALRQAEVVARQNLSGITAVQLAACAVQFWLQAGNLATAVSWVEAQPLLGRPLSLAALPIIAREVQQVSLARVHLAQGRPDEVLRIYPQLHEQVQAAERISRVIEIGLLAALAHQMQGETAVALDTLRPILALTVPEGYAQIFLELGSPMRKLLCNLLPDEQTDAVQALQQAFPAATVPASAALVEPLSPRELEVLRLIAAGLSNKQIGAELTVSLNTVKKHTTHIYGKLGVNGRTQAIACARELNLI